MATYNDYIGQAQTYMQNEQANDPAFQAWQADATRYTPDMGEAPAWTGRNFFNDWMQQLPDKGLDYTQKYQQHQADQAKSFTGRLGQVMSMIPGAVLAAGAAPVLGSLFSGVPEAATYGMDGVFNNPAFTSIPDASTGLVADYANPAFTAFDAPAGGMMSGVYNNPAFTAMPGLEGGYITQGVGAGAGAATNGVQDFFKNIGNDIKEKPMSSLIGGARALSSLAGLYSSYAQNRDYSNLAGNMMNLFGDDSAYARQLRKELQRRDAASGRRSQYGPRAVELQAKLAELASRQAPTLANIYQQQGMNRNNMMNSGLNLLKGTGAMDWFDNIMKAPLAQLFGG